MKSIPTPPNSSKPSVMLLIFTTCFVLLNAWLNFAVGMSASGNVSEALADAACSFVFTGTVALLFSIAPRFRNPQSRTKVVLWTSIVLILATHGHPTP